MAQAEITIDAVVEQAPDSEACGTMGGAHVLPVNAQVRRSAGVAAGDRVKLTLREDAEPRTVELPHDLVQALRKNGVSAAFDAMSFTHRKEWVRAVAEAKRPETRLKRIANCVAAMHERQPGTKRK